MGTQLGLANDHAVVGDDFLLGRHQQKLHLAPAAALAADELVINLHVVLGKWDVVLGFPRNLLFQFLGRHGRDLDLLDDDGVAGDGGGHLFAFDPEVVAQRLDGLDHGGLVHDRAVDDSLRRQRLEAEVDQQKALGGFLELDDLHGARSYVESYAVLGHRCRLRMTAFISLSSPTWWGICEKGQKTTLHPIPIVHFAFQVEPAGIGVAGVGVCSHLFP